MAILTLQRRLREAGRIRIGQQVKSSNGKSRPAKLDAFRLTSSDRGAIEAAAELYGGDPHPWEGAPVGQMWEVFTTVDSMPVVIPPAATAFSQFYETWSGGGCTRRCDGVRELLNDAPCLCADEDEPTCKPTTRLSVILHDLPGLGVWRLESHGYYAATELAGTVEVCIGAATRGQLLPAVLRLEQRQVKRAGEQVKKFAVPILDIRVTPSALGLVVGTSVPAAIEQPARADLGSGSWSPIEQPAPAQIGPGGEPPVGDAIRQGGREPAKRRKNSPPELPPTGVNPRGIPAETGPVDDPSKPSESQKRMVMALFKERGVTTAQERYAAYTAAVGREVGGWDELSRSEASMVIDALKTQEES